jgi:hypothetical protein
MIITTQKMDKLSPPTRKHDVIKLLNDGFESILVHIFPAKLGAREPAKIEFLDGWYFDSAISAVDKRRSYFQMQFPTVWVYFGPGESKEKAAHAIKEALAKDVKSGALGDFTLLTEKEYMEQKMTESGDSYMDHAKATVAAEISAARTTKKVGHTVVDPNDLLPRENYLDATKNHNLDPKSKGYFVFSYEGPLDNESKERERDRD